MKYLIITIDTEGDNLWEWHVGKEISTENVGYLQRFQSLCDKYDFKPVWLTNWEMINDGRYVEFINKNYKNCEVGMHLHAWNNPPDFDLGLTMESGAPYLIEYPIDVMEAKIDAITTKIVEKLGTKPVSHRAGRWAVNKKYLELLAKYGYKVDCSITPGIDWTNSKGGLEGNVGMDYSDEKCVITNRYGIYEIPVNTFRYHRAFFDLDNGWKYCVKEINRMIKGRIAYLRPTGKNIKEMKWIVNKNINDASVDYLMFMLHSSELMPGGSPTFKNILSVEKLYFDLESVFSYMFDKYKGVTLSEYYEMHFL